MEIIESFSNLFDGLSTAFEKGSQLNYTDSPVSKECAIGVILSKIPKYKKYLKKKIQSEYKSNRSKLKNSIRNELKFPDFEGGSKKLHKLGEVNNAYFARFQRNCIRNSLDKTRK